MSAVFQLTNHWTEAPIESVASVEFGTRVTKRVDAGTRYPVYGGGGATFSMDEYNREDCYIVSRFGMSEECVRRVDGKFFLNDSGLTVRTRDEDRLYQRFLDTYLLGSQARIFDLGRGAAQKNLNVEAFRQLEVPLPPLDEQKRIVAVLDQAFAALDRARALAEANLADVSDLKRRGADRLLHRHAASAPRRRLGELAEFRNGLNFSRHSSGETVKVAGVGNFQSNFWVPLDELAFATIDGQLSDSDKLCAGDILAVRSNGNEDLVGRVMLMGDVDEVVSYSGFVIRIRLTADKLDPRFLCHYIKSDEAIAHLRAGGGGANISNLNQKVLSSLTVPVPSLEEQRAFIDSMASLDTSVDTLTELAASKVADLATLRQSLLQKAFAGELT